MSEPMTMRARIDAPPDAVWHALTDADALRGWLAEHAEVRLPDTYRFWGRYTPEGDVPRQRLLHADGRRLRFVWPLGGEDTRVGFDLEPGPEDTTVLTVTQTHVPTWIEATSRPGVHSVLATFWALAVSNLVDHVTGRPTTPKCDFTARRLATDLLIAAPPERVFASLIEPERFRRWFRANLDIEPRVGGRVAMGGGLEGAGARIVELEPGRRLGIDWGPLVETWELADSAGGTRLTFVQSGFDETDPPYAGWTGALGGIGELRRYHELPGWRSIWLGFGIPGTPEGVLATG